MTLDDARETTAVPNMAGDVLDALGLICSDGTRTAAAGAQRGAPFEWWCPQWEVRRPPHEIAISSHSTPHCSMVDSSLLDGRPPCHLGPCGGMASPDDGVADPMIAPDDGVMMA